MVSRDPLSTSKTTGKMQSSNKDEAVKRTKVDKIYTAAVASN